MWNGSNKSEGFCQSCVLAQPAGKCEANPTFICKHHRCPTGSFCQYCKGKQLLYINARCKNGMHTLTDPVTSCCTILQSLHASSQASEELSGITLLGANTTYCVMHGLIITPCSCSAFLRSWMMQRLQKAREQVPQLPVAASKTGPHIGASLSSIQAVISEIVQDLVGQDVAVDAALAAQGLDSLAAMELRQRLQAIS